MEKVIKRFIDILISFLALVCLSPLFLAISIAIKIRDPGPVIFSQIRIGKGFKPFELYKFRTMSVDSHGGGLNITVAGDGRITEVGKFLRKTKLDEFPQLWNVLKGDMSLIGPRPEAEKYVRLFREDYEEVLRLRPGMTDFAAIEFRNEEEILSKFEDLEEAYINEILPAKILLYKKYVNEQSFGTDLKIAGKTIKAILK